ncbi:MAG: TRAP transporter small permease, partial [Rhodobacteraceae bacterium]|nr:TRAP transporter small permease [Paracoccaceae bacterium]
WWAYALSVFGAFAAAIVATYTAFARIFEALTGAEILEAEGAEH